MRLFVLGRSYHAAAPGDAPRETPRVAAVAIGPAGVEQWGAPARDVDFHDLKGDLESLALLARAELEFRPSQAPFGHPGRSADVYRDGERIGWIGELHPALLRELGLDHRAVAFEVELEPLRMRALPRAGTLTRFPSVRRDLALLVAEDMPWGTLEAAIREAAGPLLADLRLFDRYQGKGVETGFKSLATGLILQDNSRTLTDRDVDDVVARVTAALASHGARIRS